MQNQPNRRTNRALAATLLLAGSCVGLGLTPGALAQASGKASGVAAATAAPAVQQASSLAESGRLVEAKSVLDRFIRSGNADGDRGEVIGLLKSIDAKLRAADPIEVTLQRAELSAKEGDLLSAERWASAVTARASAGAAEKKRAQSVLTQVNSRRTEISPLIPGMVEQANADFAAGRYGAAKAGILAVLRSGVSLDGELSRTLENNQLKIVEMEQERGENFDVAMNAGLGMLAGEQPGQVRRPGQPAEPAAPADEPAANEPPANPEPAPEPAPAPEPVPYTPPPAAPVANEPSPAPAPAQPAQSDVLREAMRAEGLRIIAEADQAYEGARYTEAADKYDIAIRNFQQYLNADEISRARQRLDEARIRMGSNTSGGLIKDVTGMAAIQKQQAVAEFENEMTQARARLAAGDADEADTHRASARLAINRARDRFTQAEFDEYTRRLDSLQAETSRKRDEIARAERQSAEEKAVSDARDAERRRITERDRKVNESIDRIRALQQEQKYGEALQVVDNVLFLDPNNPTALLLREVLTDIEIYKKYNDIQRRKQQAHARQSLESEEVTIPPDGVMDFPVDWPSKTYQRGEQSAFADAPENRKVLAELSSKKLPADFNSNKLEDVFTYIQQLTQVNMDIEWDSLEAVNVRKDTPITLKLSPLPVNTLLDRIMVKAVPDQFSKIGWTVYNGVLTVASQEQLNKNRTLVIYNIQDLLFEIPDYTEVPEIDLNSVLRQSQGGGGGTSPFRDNQDQQEEGPDREERIRQIQDIITANVDFEGWRDNGGDTGTMQELNGSLIITNTPKNHREIVGLLSKLREIRNMQINVETKFLLVNQSWFEQIGFDLDVVFNADSNQVTTAIGNDPSVRPSDFFDFGADSSGGNPGLRRVITGQGPTGGQTGAIAADDRINQATVGPSNWSPIGAFQNSLGLTSGLARSAVQDDSVTAQVLRGSPALGVAGQFLDDVQVDFLIQATQADRRTVQLTAPRLTFTNGQTANIFVVTQQAFVSDLQPVVGDSAVGFDPTVSVASEGVTMLVEGVISADRRYVTMNIDAGVARIDGFGQQSVSAVAGGQLVNSADTQSFIQLPTITVTRVRTTSTVPDEGTVLLGGQRLVTEVEIETGVPVLSKIPIINRFFTNRLESKEEQTLLILVKPTILIQSEQEENKFPGLLDAARSGIGMR